MEKISATSTPYIDNKALNNHNFMVTQPVLSEICDDMRGLNSTVRLSNGTPTIRHPLDSRENSFNSDSLEIEPIPKLDDSCLINDLDKGKMPTQLSTNAIAISDDEEDRSLFQTILSPDTQDVRLKKEMPSSHKRKLISIPPELLVHPDDVSFSTDDDFDEILSPSIESLDEIEDSILEELDKTSHVDPLPQLSAEEETEESRYWQVCSVGGVNKRIDMKVIEPFKCVLSHGGYINSGSQNAIIVFSACYLPHRGRVDYNYVMENLFFYTLSTLDQLVVDDYVLVYLHGGASKDTLPKFSWLKRCYQMIDHRLRKNLRHLYIVHPTFWLKTVILMSRPFLSSKFYKKMIYTESLTALLDSVPLEEASIPDRVHQYDRIKQSIQSKRK